MAILNTFLIEAEKRGYAVSQGYEASRFVLSWRGARVNVRIAERTIEKYGADSSVLSRIDQLARSRVPSNVLRLIVEGPGYSSHEIADDLAEALENKLDRAFTISSRLILQGREVLRKQDQTRKEHEEAMERSRAIEAERKKIAQIEQENRKRAARLVKEAANWKRAQNIREYVSHVTEISDNNDPVGHFCEWHAWALSVADALDMSRLRARSEMLMDLPESPQ